MDKAERNTLRLQTILSLAVSGLLDAGLSPSAIAVSAECACLTWRKAQAFAEAAAAEGPA